ncbi:DUF5592 family protein [uncultured Clostridium sp.]|uniref:DUF5592 family protein n=1 Tax=uncultured Clostridium sp. TaxID=59620 RepID=UPI0025FADD39|nr:DUF5592 family protein [uncultured Clostridium sp.]
MQYVLPKQIRSLTKLTKSIYLYDLAFIGIFMCISWILDFYVYKPLLVPYFIFMFIMAIYFRGFSTINPKKRNYQSIYYILVRNRKTYIRF